MNKINLILIVIISIEIFFIIYLFSELIRKTGYYVAIYEPINKSQLIFYNETQIEHKYKYFYEPEGNIKIYYSTLFNRSIIIPINNDNMYERYNYSIIKPENTYRIISLGDSFTEGLWVNISDNYSEILEDLLNNYSKNCSYYKRFEVINLGVSGYDVAYSSLRFKIRGLKYRPDLVIWFLKYDDFRIIAELWQNFTSGVIFPDFQIRTDEHIKIWNSKVNDYLNSFDDHKDESLRGKYIILPLKDFFDTTRNHKINVVIFTHFSAIGGDYDELLGNMMKDYPHVTFVKLQIDQNFYNKNLTIYYNPPTVDIHPNEEGHRIIAIQLFNFLKENLLKKC